MFIFFLTVFPYFTDMIAFPLEKKIECQEGKILCLTSSHHPPPNYAITARVTPGPGALPPQGRGSPA